MSEFRYCKLNDEWRLFAPERLKRPNDLHNKKEKQDCFDIKDEHCPFDMGKEKFTISEISRIEQNGQWQCRVVPNLYNALSIDVENISSREKYFTKHTGFGAHEVVIETPSHTKQIWDFDYNDLVNYFTILQERVKSLKNDHKFSYISIFKNYGENGGASLTHSHSQIMAMPFLPKKVKEEIRLKKEFYSEHKRALLDELVYEERDFAKGVIFENKEFILYCPYASEFAFEAKIVSKNKLSSLMEFSKSEISSLSDIVKIYFNSMNKALGDISFNMIINNAPYEGYDENTKEYFRFNIELKPRLYKQAGFELDSDISINVILPEEAAKIYKESK